MIIRFLKILLGTFLLLMSLVYFSILFLPEVYTNPCFFVIVLAISANILYISLYLLLKKKLRFFNKFHVSILGISWVILWSVLILFQSTHKLNEITALVFIDILPFAIYWLIKKSKKKNTKTDIPQSAIKTNNDIPLTSVGKLIDGLPVPQNTAIITNLLTEKLEMRALIGRNRADWKTYELSFDKIENICLMNEQEIKQIITQSAPGIILGAATFGILGAMLGGRTKTKEKIKINTLLVIDYFSGEKKQIILDVTDNLKDSTRMVNKFKEIKPVSNSTIQL